jgi:hypothetical protein
MPKPSEAFKLAHSPYERQIRKGQGAATEPIGHLMLTIAQAWHFSWHRLYQCIC